MDMSRKKPHYPIHKELRKYLKKHQREVPLAATYEVLLNFTTSIPVIDSHGNDTLWQSVLYDNFLQDEIQLALVEIYAALKTDGDQSFVGQLRTDRIDHCLFGNSNPFRIRIVNTINDNHDYYYIKKADASRIYGLELEHLLSPNRIGYLTDNDTLVEEHIAGIPGDVFLSRYIDRPGFAKTRMAKEFVKFNERCFTMLLGDMRSYNYVVDVTPDFDMEQYRVRPIDFDQLTYEGRKNHYLPQFYKENLEIIQFCMEVLSPENVDQYQTEERTLIRKRYNHAQKKVNELLTSMQKVPLSSPEKIASLCQDLNVFHECEDFLGLKSMGSVLRIHLSKMIERTENRTYLGRTSFKT
tara:strand:+ start:21611 stop:22672 length:1062 start_codon:yes stop_codon:yes gene_type:complete